MPARLEKCVSILKSHKVSDDIAWGKCQNWMKAGRLREDGTVEGVKEYFYITVNSTEGVKQVELKDISEEKGIIAVMQGENIISYGFDILNEESKWTEETMTGWIKKRIESNDPITGILQGALMSIEKIAQSEFSDKFENLKKVDPEPFFVPLHIKYGLGSNKQHFDKSFFQNAGAKFEKTTFFLNHSDLTEFGKGIPIGSIVKFVGADDTGATFMAYVSASEGKLRQKIRESQALGDFGFVKKVSIEGIPSKEDFRLDEKTGIKYFHDLTMPTGIAIVNKEGLKGSSIISN